MADPDWLLQPRVTLQLNRRKTTTKKLVLNFSTFISKHISERGEQEDKVSSWALILRGTPRRIQIALEHSEVTLDCNVLSSGHQSMEWMLPDLTTLEKTDSHRIVSEHNRLVIKNTSLSDSGLYHCFVRTETDVDIISYRLTVRERLLSPSDLNGKKIDISVYLGKPISLDCTAAGKPQAQVSWILPDRTFVREIVVLDRPISLFPNGTLRIRYANFSSKGDYKCIASNAAGADTLTYHLHVAALPPTINEEASESISLNAGRSIYVHCTAKGEPEPLLKWVLPDSSQMKPTQFIERRLFVIGRVTYLSNGTLHLREIAKFDRGTYTCKATNMFGSDLNVWSREIFEVQILQGTCTSSL
uniref:Ig-like domain-containing protein n=1 Tax=Electrophorus electricus TaxID=8005 RepID=A0A4W4GIY9_ELEEL